MRIAMTVAEPGRHDWASSAKSLAKEKLDTDQPLIEFSERIWAQINV